MGIIRTLGTKPAGTATGRERWATIAAENAHTAVVTAYAGWSITDEVRLSGRVASLLAEQVAEELLSPQYKVIDGDDAFVTRVAPTPLQHFAAIEAKDAEPVVTTEALQRGALRAGSEYLVKRDGKTIGIIRYTGRQGGMNVWSLREPNTTKVLNQCYFGSKDEAARTLAAAV